MNYNDNLKVLNELRNSVKLEKDVFAYGLHYFNEKYEEIQAVRDRVLTMLSEAILNKANKSTELSLLKQQYEQKLSTVMIRDDVKPLKSSDLRLAVAHNEMGDLLNQIAIKERELTMADAYCKVVTLIYEDLKDKNENLTQQLLATRALLNVDPALRELATVKVKGE